jgi:hypothetical protein
MRHVRKNPEAVAIVLVADEDFPAGDLVAGDVEATSLVCTVPFRVVGRRIHQLPEQDVSVRVVAAINSMKKRGHDAHLYRHQGKIWVEIDQCMLASFEEIEELVDGVHSFDELAQLFKERHTEELGGH